MPKDITKLSLKEFDLVSEGEIEQRFRVTNGQLEMTIKQATVDLEVEA